MKRTIFFTFILISHVFLLNAQNNFNQDIYNNLDQQIKEHKINKKELLKYALNQYKNEEEDEEDIFDVLYELDQDCESKKEYYYLILDYLLRKMSNPQFVEDELSDVEYSYISLIDECLFDLDKQESIEDLYKFIISEVLENIKYNTEELNYDQFFKTQRSFMRLIGKHPETYFIELKSGLEIFTYQFDDSLTYSEIIELFTILENKLKYNWNEIFTQYERRIQLCNELINFLNNFSIEKEVIEYVKKSKEKLQSKSYLTSEIILNSQTFFDENKILQKNFEDSIKLLISVADKNSDLIDDENYKKIKYSLEAINNRIILFTMDYNEYAQKINKTIRNFDNIATSKGIKTYFYLKN